MRDHDGPVDLSDLGRPEGRFSDVRITRSCGAVPGSCRVSALYSQGVASPSMVTISQFWKAQGLSSCPRPGRSGML